LHPEVLGNQHHAISFAALEAIRRDAAGEYLGLGAEN